MDRREFWSSTTKQIKISSVPVGRWSLEWVGDVAFHQRHISQTQPTISGVFKGAGADNAGKLFSTLIPVGLLFSLTLGRIWSDKVLTSELVGNPVERVLKFKVASASLCPAGVPLDKSLPPRFLLPFECFDGHRQHTKSWCLQVEVDKEWVVIPAAEVIRFYFGSSAGLLKKVLSRGFSVDQLIHSAQKTGSRGKIELRDGVSVFSAWDVARIAFDKRAEYAAAMVSRSLVAGAAQGGPIYPKVELPFEGEAHMRVRGIVLNARSGPGRFFVQEIVQCMKPFPVEALDYVSTTRQKTSTDALRDRQAAGADGSANHESKSSMQRPGDLSVENREPKKSSSSEAKTVVVDRHVRFPDLVRKPTYRVSGEVPKVSIVGSFPAAPFASTGGGVSASAGKGIDPVTSSSLELDDRLHIKKPLYMPGTSWEPYFDFLEALWDEPWVEAIKFVTFNHRQRLSYYGHIPNLVNEDGEFIDATAPLVGPAGEVEQRYGSFANISVAGRWIAVVSVNPDLSRGPAMVHLYPGQILSRENCLAALADAVSDGAQARGWITFEAGVAVVQEVMKAHHVSGPRMAIPKSIYDDGPTYASISEHRVDLGDTSRP